MSLCLKMITAEINCKYESPRKITIKQQQIEPEQINIILYFDQKGEKKNIYYDL